jgi:hypothetical protein
MMKVLPEIPRVAFGLLPLEVLEKLSAVALCPPLAVRCDD